MERNIYDRVREESKYIVNTHKTIREIADEFGVSKSTVHNDLRKRLVNIDKNMYNEVSNILQYHIDIKHIRGGESTKRKFLDKKV